MPTASDTTTPELREFHALLNDAVTNNTLVRLLLTKPSGAEPELERIEVRPLTLRGVASLSFVYRYKTRDITKNYPVAEGIELLDAQLGHAFRNVHLFMQDEEIQLAFSKKGKPMLHRSKMQHEVKTTQTHDREKQRYVELERPFLTELGVTDQQRQLIPAMSRKWKQINKFIEVFQKAFDASALAAKEHVSVVDFGSGKGYLTFAIHDFLRHTRGLDAQVMGVELRENLTSLCNRAVEKLHLQGLTFRQGDVRHFAPQDIDVMIALHACDTATDYAIHMGIRSNASIIMCAPCCHKQIRPQMHNPQVLRPLLQYGVHQGQEAEMVTDTLRALLLEANGYDTQVFEFVSLEHTSKNKMILAVKRRQPRDVHEILTQIDGIKAFYGIREHCLETLLQGGAVSCAEETCPPQEE
jgi:hypothetical protein